MCFPQLKSRGLVKGAPVEFRRPIEEEATFWRQLR